MPIDEIHDPPTYLIVVIVIVQVQKCSRFGNIHALASPER